MSKIDKQALIAKIKKQTESYDTVVLREDEANALLDELEAKDRRIEEEVGRANREHHRGFMMACGHLKEHSNVHYADAAEMEIAALRKRINELEAAPPVPVSVPDLTALDSLAGEMLNHAMNCERRVAVAYTHCAHRLAEEVRDLRAAMLQGAESAESPTTIHTAPELDSSPKIAESPSGNSPVIPDGWVAVPKEPTPDMREAYHQAQAEYEDVDGLWSPDHQWKAMLAAAPHFREIVNSSTNNCREKAETSTKCWCHTCRPVTISDMRFVVCPECGNKRCPHANDHSNACTGSNEPGQEGSAYTAAPQQEVK